MERVRKVQTPSLTSWKAALGRQGFANLLEFTGKKIRHRANTALL